MPLNAPPNESIWRIGLYEWREFRNGRVGALCIECGQLFWEEACGAEKKPMGQELKKHVLTAHREYGMKLLELMVEEEEGGESANDATHTTASPISTAHSHHSVEAMQLSIAINSLPPHPAEEEAIEEQKVVLRTFAADDHFNEMSGDQLAAKRLPSAQGGVAGPSSSSTDSEDIVAASTSPISADLLAAAEQLCTSLHNNRTANTKMPNLAPNLLPNVPMMAAFAGEPTDLFSIDLPELPDRVYPTYVDEHSTECWHWLHPAKTELHAIRAYEKRLISNESGKLFFGCATDQSCPFRAVWVRERSAVYQSRGHSHALLSLSQNGSTSIGTDQNTTADHPSQLLSSPRSINGDTMVSDLSGSSQPSINALIGKVSPIVINVLSTRSADSDKTDQRATLADTFKKSMEEWKVLAVVAEDESNLTSICSQVSLSRQSVLNRKDGTTRFHYACTRRKAPFCCRFRAAFVRGEPYIYYRSEHNHSVPLSEHEVNWFREWKAQRPKVKKQRTSKVKTVKIFSPLKSLQQFVSDHPFSSGKHQQQQRSPMGNHSLANCPTYCSSISALQQFITYLDNRHIPSSSQQSGFPMNSEHNECAEKMNNSEQVGAVKQECLFGMSFGS